MLGPCRPCLAYARRLVLMIMRPCLAHARRLVLMRPYVHGIGAS